MAALRYAARRLLAGQPHQPIYRAAAVAEAQRQLFPRVIHGCSPAHSPRFISNQPSQAERLTFKETWRISKRVAHMIFRTTKAVSVIVASSMIIKLSINELFAPGNFLRETVSLGEKCQDMLRGLGDNPRDANGEYVLKDGRTLKAEQELESVLAEFESVLKNATSSLPKQRLTRHEDHGPYGSPSNGASKDS